VRECLGADRSELAGRDVTPTQDPERAGSFCERAASIYQQSCDRGYAEGCQSLGEMYRNGDRVRQDDAKAVAFFRPA
jgi:TPR repeat protein